MSLLTSLRQHTPNHSRPTRNTRRTPASKPTARFRPRLETFERRELLSTLTVTSNLDGPVAVSHRGVVIVGDGTLRGEIAEAKSGDTIVFAPSLDGKTIFLGATPNASRTQLEINKNLTIQGPGAGLLSIYGVDCTRIFQVDAGANVTISGLKIEGGNAVASYNNGGGYTGGFIPAYYDGCGGGILNLGTLTVSGCTAAGNESSNSPGVGFSSTGEFGWRGGGIANFGTMTLSGSTVTFNSASNSGGGIYNEGTMTMNGSAVTSNSAGSGGGIYNDTQAKLTILSSVVQNNTALLQNNNAQRGADICSLGWITISKDSKVGKLSYT
jgi:hypothetical protein